MAVGEVKARPGRLGGIPDFSKIQLDVAPASGTERTYRPVTRGDRFEATRPRSEEQQHVAETPRPIPADEALALRQMFAYLKRQHPAAKDRLEALETRLLSLSAQQFFKVAEFRQAANAARTPEEIKAYDARLASDPDFFISEATRDIDRARAALPQFDLPAGTRAADGQQSPAQDPADRAPEMTPEQKTFWHRVGTSIGTAIGAVFGYGFMRKAASTLAAGKPVGFFLGKAAPAIGGAIGAWSLKKKITEEWNARGNDRKWDDVIRMAGDGLQIAGAVAAFVPAAGLVAGLGLQLAGTLVTWAGEMFNDAVGKA